MKILFLGLNYPPEEIGIAVYSGEMCRWLAERGHDVEVIAAKPYYPAWRTHENHRGWRAVRSLEAGVSVTRIPIYVPAKPTGLKRIVHHLSFAVSALLPMVVRARAHRPAVVFTVAPSLIGAIIARLVARLSGARSWLHVQDFEVGAAFATDLLNPGSRLGRIALFVECAVIQGFDRVSSISPEMCRRLLGLGIPEFETYQFRNWSDVDAIAPLTAPSTFRDRWSIRTPHVLLYSGNIANKQGIDIIVDAAKRLSHRADMTFVICGEGPNRAALLESAHGLTNIQFHGLQPPDQLQQLMALATIHLLPQRADAADLVLPSKLTNMLASGRPVVATAHPGTGLANEVAGAGLVVPPGDADALAAAIQRLADDPALRAGLGREARLRAEHVWAKRPILEALEQNLLALGAPGQREN